MHIRLFSGSVKVEITCNQVNGSISCLFEDEHMSVGRVYILPVHARIYFTTPDVRSWLNHFLYIINPSKIDVLEYFENSAEFHEQRFQISVDCLKDLNILKLHINFNGQLELVPKLIGAFQPQNLLSLRSYPRPPFDSSQKSELRQILSQQFQTFILEVDIPLKELLHTNCSYVYLSSSLLTDKDINVFLKHWLAGLKPKLEFLWLVRSAQVFNPTTILEGIPHEVAPNDRELKLHYNMLTKVGGVDIDLGGGIKATMIFDVNFPKLYIAVHNTEYISFK